MNASPEVKSKDSYSCAIDPINEPFVLVIFGASGDLTKKKLIPAVFSLFKNGLLPERFFILGAARSPLGTDGFRERLRETLEAVSGGYDDESWRGFAKRLVYADMGYADPGSYARLSRQIDGLSGRCGAVSRIFYLATPPELYRTIIGGIGDNGLASSDSRIVVEKPFGSDLESARGLNGLLRQHFGEERICRIDHYLAKETVQNVLLFRFANSIFEPLWNRSHVDHVQVTVAETAGIEHRAGYYEKAGVLRDMFQNHMLQLLSLVAMEPPGLFEAEHVRNEKFKVMQSLRPLDETGMRDGVVLGQYTGGVVEGSSVPGYREEQGVDPGSSTPTYAALRVFIDNWRWQDVPFYLRTGKRLKGRVSSISIHFKHAPGRMFRRFPVDVLPNVLTFLIQPEERIILSFQAKVPGSKVCLKEVDMSFFYKEHYSFVALGAYERVLLDVFSGERLLFVRQDGIEAAWEFLMPALDASTGGILPVRGYEAGGWGPSDADDLLARDGRKWKVKL